MTTLYDELSELYYQSVKNHKDLLDKHYPFLQEIVVEQLKYAAKHGLYQSYIDIGELYAKNYDREFTVNDITEFGVNYQKLMQNHGNNSILPNIADLEYLVSQLENYLIEQKLRVFYQSYCSLIITWVKN